MGTIKTGGERTYAYDANALYTSDNLREMSQEMISTLKRDPLVGKLDELFGKGQRPLKKIGIIIFETRLQPTLDGLAGKNQIYLSESGKQIMTENMLRIWEQSIRTLSPEVDFVPASKIKKAKSFPQYGVAQKDFINSERSSLAPDDIFFLESGKKTTTATTLNPRGMRDASFLLVPASELMGGPKWSEHNKHFLNDVVKELNLDAALIAMSEVSWTAAHIDKHSGEFIPEEVKVKIKSSILLPLSHYHQRLENLDRSERPNVSLCYRTYESQLNVPVVISLPSESRNFDMIERELLVPMYKTYKDLSQMILLRMSEDLKKTW
jgi:hypothetical protein